jgi:hypothetical protein
MGRSVAVHFSTAESSANLDELIAYVERYGNIRSVGGLIAFLWPAYSENVGQLTKKTRREKETHKGTPWYRLSNTLFAPQ